MSRNLARFKEGRIRGAYTGLKRRAKNLLARPGIQKAMKRVGGAAGNAAGWVKQKTGFSRSYSPVATFARRRFLRKRKGLLRRLALPAAGVGVVGALGGAGYLAHRSNKSFNDVANKAQSTLRSVRQQGVNDAINSAQIKARLQERARGYKRNNA